MDKVLKEMKGDGSLGKLAEQDLGVDVFTAYADVLSDNELMND